MNFLSGVLSALTLQAGMETAYLQIDYAKAADVAGAIERRLSPHGSVTFDPRLNTVTVTDSAYVLEQIDDYVERIDRPKLQVLVEIEIMQPSDPPQGCEHGCASLSSYRVPVWGVAGALGYASGAQPSDKHRYSRIAAPRLIVGDGDWGQLGGGDEAAAGPWLLFRASAQADHGVVLDLHFMARDSCAAVAQLHLSTDRMVAMDWPLPPHESPTRLFVSARAIEP